MFAQVPQPLAVEVGGYIPRQDVVTALTCIRHKIEKRIGPCTRMPVAEAAILSDLCQRIGLTQFEIIEVMGSSWCVDQLWGLLTPIDKPIPDWLKWTNEHEGADLGQVLLTEDSDD